MQMKLINNTGQEEAEAAKNWLEYISRLFEMTYAIKPVFSLKPDDPINASNHFLNAQISSVDWYDLKGHKQTIYNFQDFLPTEKPSKLVTKIGYLEIEYTPKSKGQNERVSVSGLEYDANSTDLDESMGGMMEKACAAMALAYMAQANGWTEVNFANTTDPIERALLINACDSLHINYGRETVWESAVEGVDVTDESAYAKSSFIQTAIVADVKKQGIAPEEVDLVQAAASAAFNMYTENQVPMISKHTQSPPNAATESTAAEKPAPHAPPPPSVVGDAASVLGPHI
jgi:hypothetical protein